MLKHIARLSVLTLFVCVFATFTTSANAFQQYNVDMSANNSVLTVNHDDAIVIKLRECPTCGYQWQLASYPLELEFVEDRYISDYDAGKSPFMVGGGGERSFLFFPYLSTGLSQTPIQLELRRPWTPPMLDLHAPGTAPLLNLHPARPAPVQTFRLYVNVL